MAGFSSWFTRGTPQSKPTDNQPILQANKVISGRVTKPVSSGNILRPEKYIRASDKATDECDDISAVSMRAQPVEDDYSTDIGEPIKEISIPDTNGYIDGISDFVSRSPEIKSPSSEDISVLSSPSRPPTEEETDSDFDDEADGWRHEQIFLNQVLKARDEFTFMPSTWRMHFRGIPLPEGLFYQQQHAVSTRPRIYARTERHEYRGAMALRKLMDIHGRIRDLRKEQKPESGLGTARRIVDLIRQRLIEALHWAELDGDIAKYSNYIVPNVKIIEMEDVDRQDMDLHIQEEMEELAITWRETLNRLPEADRPVAPVLFGFVIFKHIVFIVTLDSENPNADCHIPCQLNMSERNQHQWNALAIMVTVCWARDLFEEVLNVIPKSELKEPKDEESSSDPDA